MEDKKQIKEMANFIYHTEFIDISYYEAEKIAIELLKHYQLKIPEDSIIVTKEEWAENHNLAFMSGKKEGRKETAEIWHYHITAMLLALWKGCKITTEVYNSWIIFFNGLAKHYGVEVG